MAASLLYRSEQPSFASRQHLDSAIANCPCRDPAFRNRISFFHVAGHLFSVTGCAPLTEDP